MNISIISNYFFPEVGAAPRRISDLAKGLSEEDHNVEVICPMPNYPKGEIFHEYKGSFFMKEHLDKVSVRRYWISPSVSKNPILRAWSMFSFAFNLFFEIPHLIKRKPEFVIIQNSPLLVSFIAILISKLVKTKIILNVSDLWPLSAVELGVLKPGSKMHSFLSFIEKFNYRNCNAIMGQSGEILDHISQSVSKKTFLYRNLLYSNMPKPIMTYPIGKHKIIYAGLLGVAQGILDIIQNIDLSDLDIEIHIYGDGNERYKIEKYLTSNLQKKIIYKGTVSHSEMMQILPTYSAALVPLKTKIKGAVPSKIFELAAAGVPVLFAGGGEGEKIVNEFSLGWTSNPDDFIGMQNNISILVSMPSDRYIKIKEACINASSDTFDFKTQILKLNNFFKEINN